MSTIKVFLASTFLVTSGALAGCSGEEHVAESADDGSNEIGTGDWLESVADISDFGNVVRLTGLVGMFEGSTTLALFNHSRPHKEGVLHRVNGGGMGLSRFQTDVDLGDLTKPDGLLAAPGECVSVANVGGGGRMKPLTLEEARGMAPFGAFAYAHTDGAGNPHPSWAIDGPKVYRSVAECLADPMRNAKDDGSEKLVDVTDPSDFGNTVGLKGYILFGEGEAHLVLRNASRPDQNGPDNAIGSASIRKQYPKSISSVEAFETHVYWKAPNEGAGPYWSPANGDCITAVSQHLFGKGGEEVIGAFRWCHLDGRGAPNPACPIGIEVFDTPAACLASAK